jgi:hypothetical protein
MTKNQKTKIFTILSVIIIVFLVWTTVFVSWEHASNFYNLDTVKTTIGKQLNIWQYGEPHPQLV